MKRYNFVVVGGGLAGLYTAHFLSLKGRVALISEKTIEDSNSYMAQGGMAAVIASEDSPTDHFNDTIEAGRGLCDLEAVRTLTEEAPHRIRELIEMGMVFDQENGHLALGLEGGHRRHRIVHAGGDATGRKVTSFMISKVQHNTNIDLYSNHQAVQIAVVEGRVGGLKVYDRDTHSLHDFVASSVILATGGAAALYAPTTNPAHSLGDGIAMAHDCGATVMDMEFVQFHPTALYLPGSPSLFLISEAVRGEGAHLYNAVGQRFMLDKHPLAELAPRDVVARAIFHEIHTSGQPYVTLSLRHLEGDRILHRFPSIAHYCEQEGYDLRTEIPVTPAAHYTVGGVRVDLNGETNIQGLYAVGEVASTGVMGANRLASNSLVECAVFAKRIATTATGTMSSAEEAAAMAQLAQHTFALGTLPDERAYREGLGIELLSDLRETMMKWVGIVRNEASLRLAIQYIEDGRARLDPLCKRLIEARFTAMRYDVALLIARSALARSESRGGHYRSDYPDTFPEVDAYRTVISHEYITHQYLHPHDVQ